MVVHIVAGGRTAKPTATVFVLDPKARAPTPAPGTLASRFPVSTPGPVAAHTRANGRTASDMDWAWRPATGGCTAASGRRATRAATACARAPPATPSTRAPGPTDFKTDTALKLTLMAEHTKDNGCAACGTGTVCERRRPSAWPRTTEEAREGTEARSPRWRTRRGRRTLPNDARRAWTTRAEASCLRPAPRNRAAVVRWQKNLKRDCYLNYVSSVVQESWTSAARGRCGRAARGARPPPGCRRWRAPTPP
ncbi:uncharacterized protein LOC135087793 [Ostrinia nubilalis]|uniref:uncharacterized protein LOC135087793 n=1 Tax=Ostrinia nubilalis TaxID=29057 RepID=UPI0030824B0A